MPPTDNHGSPVPFVSFRRSILSIRGDEVHSFYSNNVSIAEESVVYSFQKLVSDRFRDLLVSDYDEFLSISWTWKLLDAFMTCQESFSVILFGSKSQLHKPPLDRIVSDFFDRTVKALDICNAAREGIEKIRMWQKHLDIVISALDCKQRTVGEGQFRRARKALMDLAVLMLDEKDTSSVFSHHRSFGRSNRTKYHRQGGHSRSLSWSLPNSWSAAKQLQLMANNLVAPREHEVTATNGLASIVFTMSFVQMLVLWALVALFPCQDRGLHVHFPVTRQLFWSAPLYSLQAQILEESKKRDRKNTNGLLSEVCKIEKSANRITDLVDSVHFPLTEEQKEEVREGVEELSSVHEVCKTGLDPLERKLRDVFKKIMSCRTEGLEFLGRSN